MGNVLTGLTEKQVLVISDNDTLAQVIESSLRCGLKVQVKTLVMSSQQHRRYTNDEMFDLIVVAMSSPSNEPVIALARASLGGYIGQIPILIISDKSFQPDLGVQIAHLDFPFVIEKLNDKVSDILYELASDLQDTMPGAEPRMA